MGMFNKKELLRINELEIENDGLKKQISTLQNEKEALLKENKELITIIDDKNSENEEYSVRITEKNEQINDLLETINVLKEKIFSEEKYYKELGLTNYKEISDKVIELDKKKKDLDTLIEKEKNELDCLEKTKKLKKQEIDNLNLEFDIMDFGLYKPKYNCLSSSEYSIKIKSIRDKQKSMIKNKSVITSNASWKLNDSISQGNTLINLLIKHSIKAFNYDCDKSISSVKFNNFDQIKKHILTSAKSLNKDFERYKIVLSEKYIELKISELHLQYEYQCKKQEEKEQEKEWKEIRKEQEKVKKEIEEKRKRLMKERKQYEDLINKYTLKLPNSISDEKAHYLNIIDDAKEKLEVIQKGIYDVDYREANERAGYVYVISNIGSFGEGIYKIGMTRRLNPQDRIDELGGASVPFKFDVHAMVFSDDAPKLESALHKAFEDKKVNMMNGRKEFFKVSLDEIEKVLKMNHEAIVEFNKEAEAQQYRETIKLLEK